MDGTCEFGTSRGEVGRRRRRREWADGRRQCSCWVPWAVGSAAQGSDWPQWRGAESRRAGGGRPTPPTSCPRRSISSGRFPSGGGQSSPIVVGDPRLHPRPAGRGRSRARPLGLDRRGTLAARLRGLLRAENRGHPVRPGSEVDHAGRKEAWSTASASASVSWPWTPDSGDVRWKKTFDDLYEAPYPVWGTASSPLIEGDLLIVPIGTTGNEEQEDQGAPGRLRQGDRRGSLARRRAAGVRPRPWRSTHGGGAADRDPGRTCPSSASGPRTAIRCGRSPSRRPSSRTTPTTLRYDGNFILSGYQWGTAAIKVEPPAKANGAWSVSEGVEDDGRGALHGLPGARRRPSVLPLEQEGRRLRLPRPRHGRGRLAGAGRWAAYASVIAVDDRLLVLTDEAQLKVIAADPSGYRELASWEVADSTTWGACGAGRFQGLREGRGAPGGFRPGRDDGHGGGGSVIRHRRRAR